MLKVNDFFCGCGGIGLGFKQAGFEVQWACDIDKFAISTYKHNVGDYAIQADIKELSYKDIPQAEAWTFGFPCQDLSLAGKQRGFQFICEDCKTNFNYKEQKNNLCPKCGGTKVTPITRSGLFFEMMRLLDEIEAKESNKLPQVLFIENVKGIKKYLPALQEELNERGYNSYSQLFNSKYWGVPQNRERYFIIAFKNKVSFSFPVERKDFVPKLKDFLDKGEIEQKVYFRDEQSKTILNNIKKKIKDDIDTNYIIDDTYSFNRDLILVGMLDIKGNDSIRRVYDIEGISPTLTTCGGGNTQAKILDIDKIKVRKLTPSEYGRLQGFPIDNGWEQVVSNTQAYKQFGNSVTIPVVKAIAEKIKGVL